MTAFGRVHLKKMKKNEKCLLMVPSQGLIPVDVHNLNEMNKMYNYDMAWVNVINKLK